MTKTNRWAATLTVLTGLAVVSCDHDNTPTVNAPSAAEGTGVPEGVTNAQNTADLRVTDRLAAARCQRAQDCNDIGDGKVYASHDLCMQQVRGNVANDLTGYKCPHGLDNGAVDGCAIAIGNGACGNSESLSRMSECKTETLCLR